MSRESKTDIWMPIFIGDYLADTGHLSTEQHGAYLLVLMHQWRTGHFTEDEMRVVTRLPDAAWSTSQAALKKFFSNDEVGLLYNPRLDREKDRWCEKRRVFAERARKGGLAKAAKSALGTPQAALGTVLEECTSPSPLPAQKKQTTAIARSVPPEELAGTLPLVDGSDFPISKAQIDEWSQAYPGIDVKTELRRWKVWLDANPKRKKTRSGILRATIGWLTRAQDRGAINAIGQGKASGALRALRESLSEDQEGFDAHGPLPWSGIGNGAPIALLEADRT